MFRDRQQAGRILAKRLVDKLTMLDQAELQQLIVVAIPRGGVCVAQEVAKQLHAPLTLLSAKKIGAPQQPEFAIGAVSSTGVVVLNDKVDTFVRSHMPYIRESVAELSQQTRLAEELWLKTAGVRAEDLSGRCVIVVDDGVATGMTTEAAVMSVKILGAAKIILAAPIVAAQVKQRLANICDLIVAVLEPDHFIGIAEFYQDFHQVDDQEVIDALRECQRSLASTSMSAPCSGEILQRKS